MAWLFEDPTLILLAGGLVQALLIVALVRTGRGAIMWAIAGVAVLMGILLVIEYVVVTEREEVIDTLHAAAAALESNDLDAVIALIAPEAADLRREAESRLPGIVIRSVKLRRLDVAIRSSGDRATAEASMLLRVEGRDRQGQAPYENFLRPVTITLRREADRWLITGYREVPQEEYLP